MKRIYIIYFIKTIHRDVYVYIRVAQPWENRVNCRDILCWTICSETMMCVLKIIIIIIRRKPARY